MHKAQLRIAILSLCGLLLVPLLAAGEATPVTTGTAAPADELPAGFEAELDRMTAPGTTAPPNWWLKLGELLLALVIIVAMIMVVAHLMRRTVGRGGASAARSAGPMRLLGSFHFDPRHSVQLLELDKCVLVLGLGEGSVSLLDKIEDKAVIEELRRAGPEAETLRHFGEHLKSAFSRVKKSENLVRSKEAVEKLKQGLKDKGGKEKR